MAEETGKVIPIRLEDEMQKSYIDYAMSVIVGRALPDVRDGLKPVHRRILYGMYGAGMTSDKPHKKSARVVGDVMARYHPHGDSAIYDAMVRLAQDFSIRYPLVDGHGNFGSVDGDSAAAMRYTEARLSKIAGEMLRDIEKETVDFVPNYDESMEEPTVLPSRIPNLLVNGSAGIAVGMATNIPPHNLREVIDGIIMLIKSPDVTTGELMQAIKGPDFPTGGIIIGRKGIEDAYQTGRGSITVRAKAVVETLPSGKNCIYVRELPYQVNKAKLIERIAHLVKEKKIDGITDLRDESDREGMQIAIELRRDAKPRVVLNQLYKHTQMQENFGAILLALVDGRPKILGLKDMLCHYLEHQKDVVTRRTKYDLRKAKERAHIVEGLRIALNNLDEVIRTIRQSKDVPTAKTALMTKFGLSELQAQAILDMRLQKLTGLERDKLEQEYKDLVEKIAFLESVLADEKKLLGIIRDELAAIRDKYSDKRRTEIEEEEDDIDIEDLIPQEDVVITVTHRGYIKRMPVNTYKSQKRGGRGVIGLTTAEEDITEHMFIANTHHFLLFFTNRGVCYRLKVYEIPEAGRQAKGQAIVNLLSFKNGEYVTAVIPIRTFKTDKFLFMATKNGTVKKTPLSEYRNARREGLIAISLVDDNDLIGVKLTDGNREIMMATRDGLAIRFHEKDVRSMGRTTRGVIGIRLNEGDEVVGIDLVRENAHLLTITEKGYGKRTPLTEYRPQIRGGKGIITMRTNRRNGKVVSIQTVNANEELLIISRNGIIIRQEAAGISQQGRATQGIRVMRLDEDDRIVSVARHTMKTTDDVEKQGN